MRLLRLTCAGVLIAASLAAAGQDEITALRDAVLKKQMYLRNFSAEEHVRGHWDGSGVLMDEPRLRMLAAFTPRSVEMNGEKVVIKGSRLALLRDSETHMTLVPLMDSVSIEVDVSGANRNAAISGLAGTLFFGNMREALAGLPSKYRKRLPARMDQGVPNLRMAANPCDCADTESKECAENADLPNARGITPPHLLHSVEPTVSDKANRQSHFDRIVEVGLDVDVTGHTGNIWVLSPAGLDLDGSAGDAVREYRFAPALCHGKAVATTLYIDVHFQKPSMN